VIAWLDPYPDQWLEGIADAAPGPAARYEQREAVQIAFVAAIQHLPPRQRAVLLLREVLGWSASETAGLLDTSVSSVNSALQRARATLAQRFPSGLPNVPPTPDERQRTLLDRYARAWEGADLEGFVALLRDDAVLSMPPFRGWYRGQVAVRTFIAWAWQQPGNQHSCLLPIVANRQPAFAQYVHGPDELVWQAYAIWLPTLQDDAISALTGFIKPQLFDPFGLPATLSVDGSVPWTR